MAKWFSVMVVLLLGYFVWRHRRSQVQMKTKVESSETETGKVLMLACATCGVLSPSTDMLIGRHGHYCNDAHRQLKEGSM
jgi:uncharacterized iron-regulated membrane protein